MNCLLRSCDILCGVSGTARARRAAGCTPGGVLARVASSHLRVGTVEYLAIQEDHDTLRRLVGLALDRHGTDGLDRDADHPALVLLEAVGRRQVRLVARWMELGFVHGITNRTTQLEIVRRLICDTSFVLGEQAEGDADAFFQLERTLAQRLLTHLEQFNAFVLEENEELRRLLSRADNQ